MAIDLAKALELATQCARIGGDVLRKELHRSGGPRNEAGTAPVDAEVEDIIRYAITDAFPRSGFRSEERPDAKRRAVNTEDGTWLVDPNDGTRAFLRGHRGSSISIALIRDGRPVLGVVYAYAAPDDEGDLLAWAEDCGPMTRNGRFVLQPDWSDKLEERHTVLVSNSADEQANAYARAVAPARFRPMPGIAYRLAMAAASEGIAAVSLGGPRDFDFAGGHALLRGVGGDVLDERGRPVRYSDEDMTRSGFCFGGARAVCEKLARVDWQGVMQAPRAHSSPYDLVRPMASRLTRDALRLRRAQGCWLGHIAGDALGSQVDFLGRKAIETLWPEGLYAMVDGGTHGTLAGQPTDDAELARLLARVLLDQGKYDDEAVARAYRWWLGTKPFDVPVSVLKALSAATEPNVAVTARASASRTDLSACALSRVVPLAIAGHNWSARKLAAAAMEDAKLTNPHPICQGANAALVMAIAHGIREACTAEEVFTHTVAGAKALELHHVVIETLEAAADSSAPPDSAQNATSTLQSAFHELLYADSFANGIMGVAEIGGEAGTNAAVTGALLGAVHGFRSIPPSWVRQVITSRPAVGLPDVYRPRPRPLWCVDALVLAEQLFSLGEHHS